MNSYKSVILPQAEKDIDETLSYISNELENPQAAKNLLGHIIKTIEIVTEFPYSMPLLKNNLVTDKNEYRRADIDNFVIIYKVVEESKEVRIMAAFYTPSDIVQRFLKRI
ncbi:MAG: type II toxin-antitoxin system RelE/ParE family toxin [Clostridia bacterium]|nr:type II toxin-antitoxin system RelE/ParE family toxin [Clostridia bacterium]